MVAAVLDADEASHMAEEAGRGWRHDVIRHQAVEFGRISHNTRHAWHLGEHPRLKFGSATGDQDPRSWTPPMRTSDRLTGLANRLIGDGAAVDDDPVFVGRCGARDGLAL